MQIYKKYIPLVDCFVLLIAAYDTPVIHTTRYNRAVAAQWDSCGIWEYSEVNLLK